MGEAWQQVDAWSVVPISEVSGHDLAAPARRRRRDAEAHRPGPDRDVRTRDGGARALPVADDDAETVVAYAGHSLGEYSALVAAGVLDIESAARLVAARGAAMLAAADAQPGTMVAVMGMEEPVLAAAVAELQGGGARGVDRERQRAGSDRGRRR